MARSAARSADRISERKPHRKKGGWRKVLLCAVFAPILLAVVLAIDIYAFSFASDAQTADAAVVLGAEVWNGRPSPVFEERIKHAVHLYKTGQVRKIIFTGGIGENDQLAESVAARNYAVMNGVAADSIFCEQISKTTLENLQGAQVVMQAQQIRRVMIVSDPLHMRRAVAMARDLGMDAYPSPTPTSRYKGFRSQLDFLLHEVYNYSSYYVQRLLRR